MKSGRNPVILCVLNVFRFLHQRKNMLFPLIMYDSKIKLCSARLIYLIVREKIKINLVNVSFPSYNNTQENKLKKPVQRCCRT